MDPRRIIAAAAVAAAVALAPRSARPQFQPVVMKVPSWRYSQVAGAGWTGAGGADVLNLQTSGAGQGRLYPHHDLLGPVASPYTGPAANRTGAVGVFDGDPATSIPDVAWNPSSSFGLAVTWGESPSTYDSFASVFAHWTDGMAAIRLLPRPQPVVVATAGKAGNNLVGDLTAVDLQASRGPPAVAPTIRTWTVPAYWPASDGDIYDRIYPLRLSPGARAGNVEDAIVPFTQGFFLLWHTTAPQAGARLDTLDVQAVGFGSTAFDGLLPYLPEPLRSTFTWGSCLGAAGMDVDGDGVPDLVFSYSDVLWDTYAITGSLLWIPNGGDPVAMAAAQPWGSLMGRSDLAAITDVGTLRQIELDSGEPAFAVQDRARERIVIVRGDGVTGFTTSELPTTGGYVQEMTTIDVVGSPAKDLLALVELAPTFTTWELWVYPDVGDTAPTVAWRPVPPTSAPIGADLQLAVDASDPDAPPLTVRWLGLPGGEVTGATSVTVDGSLLCDPAATMSVSVRAMDALGVYQTTAPATVAFEERPSLAIIGAEPAGRILVEPGGASGRAAGEAWPRCGGAPSFTWGQVGVAGLVVGTPASSGPASAVDFTIPEAAYPDLLDGDAALTLRAVDTTRTPAWDGTAVLPLAPDARGLVSASVSFDEAALAAGDLGVARVELASRIGVALPGVRVLVRLDGLAFAGPMAVSGAPSTPGSVEGEVIVDPLPPRGATVEILVPVRSGGIPGGVSVELFSSGGIRVSPEASPPGADAIIPGCGCGAGGVEALPVAFAMAFVLRRRRRG